MPTEKIKEDLRKEVKKIIHLYRAQDFAEILLDLLEGEYYAEFRENFGFCCYCGIKDKHCQCWNDE